MKYKHDRLAQAERTFAMVSVSSISIEQAISTAISIVGGTAFEAKLTEVDEKVVWIVKIVCAGQRCKVDIDARSGRVIDAKAEIDAHESSGRPSSHVASGPFVASLK